MRFWLSLVMVAWVGHAQEPGATLLAPHVEQYAIAERPVSEEAVEVARLEALPAVAIPVQDETLGGAITLVATAAGMNFIAPTPADFPEPITLTTKVSPWRLLHRLGERYGFTMAFHDGIWEFNRETAREITAKVYALQHTNLDVYKTTQNAFSSVATTAPNQQGERTDTEGGMVFSAESQKIIDDVRQLVGLGPAGSSAGQVTPASAPAPGSEGPPAGAKVIYIPDRNALYVACTRAQHRLVEGYVSIIDRPPRQVRVEARFFETSWDPKTVLGINPENLQPRVSLSNIRSSVDLSNFTSQADRAVLSVDDVSVQLNALRTDTHSRLVQNPTVVTANNREVYFSIGDEEPFVSSNNLYPGMPSGGFGSSTTNVAIRRIGTSVNIVPTIFEGAPGSKPRIRLVVRIEVGALKGFRQVNAINLPVVTSQKYEYTTYVDDNHALAFGGLSGIGESDTVKKVPIAGDVPGFGYLFKSKSREIHQRNLVAYIIARVVDTPDPVELPTVALRQPDLAGRTVFPK